MARKLSQIAKGGILGRMDLLSRDRERVAKALAGLREDVEVPLVTLGVEFGYVLDGRSEGKGVDGDEARHLAQHWFDPENGWWRDSPDVEQIFRQALIKAGELALEHRLPVDTYWICAGERVEIDVTLSREQVTMIVKTPMPPTPIPDDKFPALEDIWVIQSGELGPGEIEETRVGNVRVGRVKKRL